MKPNDGFLSGGKHLLLNNFKIKILDNSRLYEYICQHFLATIMRSCKYEIQTIK